MCLTSSGHRFSDVVLDDVNFERTPYDAWQAYGRSKTANALFAAVCEPFADTPIIHTVSWVGDDPASETGLAVRIEGDGFRDIWRITARSGQGDAPVPTEGAALHTYVLDEAAPESGS